MILRSRSEIEALDDQGHRDDGGKQQGPDRPACGLDDGEQLVSLSFFWVSSAADFKPNRRAAASFRGASTRAARVARISAPQL